MFAAPKFTTFLHSNVRDAGESVCVEQELRTPNMKRKFDDDITLAVLG
jgi:hypothetical protein